jgi:ferredoxin
MLMTKYRIDIDRRICQGFGACVELCPEAFYLSELDGKSRLRNGVQDETDKGKDKDYIEVEDLGCYGQAEAACPFNAITVTRL